MVDSLNEVARLGTFEAEKRRSENDYAIVMKRNAFKNNAQVQLEQIAGPMVRKLGVTSRQEEVLHGVILDAAATLKIGRTSSEMSRNGTHRGNLITFDPLLEGWKERIKRSGALNVDKAFKTAQDAAVFALNESPNLGTPQNQK